MPALTFDTTLLDEHRDATVVVALSGGFDSTVLLHALSTHPAMHSRRLRAVHVNHALHPDAPHWAEHCASLCDRARIEFECVDVSVVQAGDGPEAAARRARHSALQACIAPGDIVAFAHHRDDQAETFLLRALRASGPEGLASMRSRRPFGAGWLWRPLLDVPRAALHAYAQAHRLEWLEDPSNADDEFDRNFLRLHVLPLLRTRWPHADAALAMAAARSAQASALLDDEDARALAGAEVDPTTLDVRALLALDPARRARVLRRWVASLGLPALPAEGVRRIGAEVLTRRADACPEFAWQGARVRRWRALLRAERPVPALPRDWSTEWSGEAPLALPGGGMLLLDPPLAFAEPIEVHARRGGERIRLPGRNHHHALKHVLQERDVPPWDREQLPLLHAPSGEVLAAGDVVFNARFAGWLASTGATLTWQRPTPVAKR